MPFDEITIFSKDEIFEIIRFISNNRQNIDNQDEEIKKEFLGKTNSQEIVNSNSDTDGLNANIEEFLINNDNVSSIIENYTNNELKEEFPKNSEKELLQTSNVQKEIQQEKSYFDQFPEISNINKEKIEIIKAHLIELKGAVVHQGLYPIGGPTNINDLIIY